MKLFSCLSLSVALIGANSGVFAEHIQSDDSSLSQSTFSETDLEARKTPRNKNCDFTFNPCQKRGPTGPTGPCCIGPTGPSGLPSPAHGEISAQGCTGTIGSPLGSTLVFPFSAGTLFSSPLLNMTVANTTGGAVASALQSSVNGTFLASYSFSGNIVNGVVDSGNSEYILSFQLAKDGTPPVPLQNTRQIYDGQVDGIQIGIPQSFIPINVSGSGLVQLNQGEKLVLLITQKDANANNPTTFGSIDVILNAVLNSSP